MYLHHSGGRAAVASRDYPLQRLHSNFENDLWNEKNEERPDDMAVESQLARYFAVVSERFEMSFWIFEGSHRSVRPFH